MSPIPTPLMDTDGGMRVAGIQALADEIGTLSTGVIIGLGGSGIQTISRLRSRVQSVRPDAIATASLAFLGIDSVTTERQVPPLPPGVGLEPSEYVNLTENTFDAHSFIRHNTHDATLSSWWDDFRTVPHGPQTDGMKQDRMLGRLAFYRDGSTLSSRIVSAVSKALTLNRHKMQQGFGGAGAPAGTARFYIVNSSCGGTGSSGLLEVLYAIWSACRSNAMTPAITMFTYTPGVFEPEISRTSQSAADELSNLRANAYAYFREFDHFVERTGELSTAIGHAHNLADPELADGDLVRQVFLIDSLVPGAGYIPDITDTYEMTAEAMFQFLMTPAGDEALRINATNSPVLEDRDVHHKRRLYCGLLIGSATYPGDTIRYHLGHRFYEYVIRRTLLEQPINLTEVVAQSGSRTRLVDQLHELTDDLTSVELPEGLDDVRHVAEGAPETLRADPEEEMVANTVATIRGGLHWGITQYSQALQRKRRAIADRAPDLVIETSLDAGKGAPFVVELLSVARRDLEHRLRETDGDLEATRREAEEGEPRSQSAYAEFTRVRSRWFAAVLSRSTEQAAEHLGQMLKSWVGDAITRERLKARAELLRDLIATLRRLEEQTIRSQRTLEWLATQASAQWRQDNLIGKDRNPLALTALVPDDILPQVEECRLNVDAFTKVQGVLEAADLDEELSRLMHRWRGRASLALFGLGSLLDDDRSASQRTLMAELGELADLYVFESGKSVPADPTAPPPQFIVPRSLEAAADAVDGGKSLDKALISLQGLAKKVALAIDEAKLGAGVNPPAPTTTIVAPHGLLPKVTRMFPEGNGLQVVEGVDQEKVVAINMRWGASLHSVSQVSAWEVDYRRRLARLPQEPQMKRFHLHREWHSLAGYLTVLVPDYVNYELAADVFARLELSSRLLDSDKRLQEAVFPAGLPALTGSRPLWVERHPQGAVWQATVYRADPDPTRGWHLQRSLPLGDSHDDALAGVGKDMSVAQYAPAFTDQLVDAAGLDAAITVLATMIADHDKLIATYPRGSSDAEAIGRIRHSANELLRRFERNRIQFR